jgi:rhodanese-related sulfurtransferase
VKSVLLEGLLVAFIGAVLAFAANALSPNGLSLTRDYFPGAERPHPLAAPATRPAAATAGTNTTQNPATEALAARLEAKGLHLAQGTQVQELFHDPRRDQNLVLFIDARNDEHYQEGHIPGAYQLDYYHPENYLPALLPLCQAAQQIVVYCNGGDCEDSELAATMLRDVGVPAEKLLVYGGGITECDKSGFPIEINSRNSGKLRAAAK